MTAGTVYLLFNYTELLRRPMEQIRTQLQDLQKAGASVQRVEDVAFAYDPGDPVLHNLTFQVPPGAVLGLLGRTGSGKSTLARLLLRFYDASAGEIHLGGVALKNARVGDLRKRVGFVSQARRPGDGAGVRWRGHLLRRGTAARLRPGLSGRPRPGDPGRGILPAGPGHGGAAGAGRGPAAGGPDRHQYHK